MTEEGDIKSQIVEWLNGAGIYWNRIQCGKVKVRGGWMVLAKEGTPDLFALAQPWGIVWLETKSLTGKQREAQKEFQERVEALGMPYLMPRDLQTVVDFFERKTL